MKTVALILFISAMGLLSCNKTVPSEECKRAISEFETMVKIPIIECTKTCLSVSLANSKSLKLKEEIKTSCNKECQKINVNQSSVSFIKSLIDEKYNCHFNYN